MVLLRAPELKSRLWALRDVRDLPPGIADALPGDDDAALELDHLLLVRISHWAALEGVADSLLACSLDPAAYTLTELLQDAEPADPSLDADAKGRVMQSILAGAAIPTPSRSSSSATTGASTSRALSRAPKPFQIAVERASGPERTFAQEWRDTGREVTAVINVLVSMVAVATAAWWASAAFTRSGLTSRPSEGLGLRVIFSLIASLAIGLIEGWLYVRMFQRRAEGQSPAPRAKPARPPPLRVVTNSARRPRRSQSESNIAFRPPSPLNPTAGALSAIGLSSAKPELPPLRRSISYRGRGDVLRMRAIAGERARREAALQSPTSPMPELSTESRKLR